MEKIIQTSTLSHKGLFDIARKLEEIVKELNVIVENVN